MDWCLNYHTLEGFIPDFLGKAYKKSYKILDSIVTLKRVQISFRLLQLP